jgi:hypothetical protein
MVGLTELYNKGLKKDQIKFLNHARIVTNILQIVVWSVGIASVPTPLTTLPSQCTFSAIAGRACDSSLELLLGTSTYIWYGPHGLTVMLAHSSLRFCSILMWLLHLLTVPRLLTVPLTSVPSGISNSKNLPHWPWCHLVNVTPANISMSFCPSIFNQLILASIGIHSIGCPSMPGLNLIFLNCIDPNIPMLVKTYHLCQHQNAGIALSSQDPKPILLLPRVISTVLVVSSHLSMWEGLDCLESTVDNAPYFLSQTITTQIRSFIHSCLTKWDTPSNMPLPMLGTSIAQTTFFHVDASFILVLPTEWDTHSNMLILDGFTVALPPLKPVGVDEWRTLNVLW